MPSLARSLGLILALAAMGPVEAATAGKRVAFVGCPILRNTHVPCWLGKDRGDLYYIGPQGDLQAEFYPPQFGHRMLVEGVLSDEPDICGGKVLKEVTASVLPDLDPTCNVILPAESYPDPPNHRGPGPSGDRASRQPEARVRREATPPPKPPFEAKAFVVRFNVDSDRKWRPAAAAISQAHAYARATNAARVEVTGYRASIRLSSGEDYVEQAAIAEARARVVEEAFGVLGLPASTRLVVKWEQKPAPSTGTEKDAEARRATIVVTPGRAAAD